MGKDVRLQFACWEASRNFCEIFCTHDSCDWKNAPIDLYIRSAAPSVTERTEARENAIVWLSLAPEPQLQKQKTVYCRKQGAL